MPFLFVLLAGVLFGSGLALSTMVRPEVVLAFLRFEDMGLMLVMAGAVAVTLAGFRLAPRLLARPVAGAAFDRHPSVLSRDTVLGAALFGIGWGLCGVCPGPAVAGLGAGNWPLLLALLGLLLGAYVHGRFFGRAP